MFGAFVVQFWAAHDIGTDCQRRCGLWSLYLRDCISKALKEMGR